MTTLDETKALLGQLISYPTISSDSNLALVSFLAEQLEAAGANVQLAHSDKGGKANLWATLGPDEPGGIVLSGHTDVVPVTDQDWSNDPFVMTENDSKLFGRGTCDMKGFIAAAVAKAPEFAARPLRRPLHFSFTYDEETGCLGAQDLARWLKAKDIRPSLAIIGEPTMMAVVEGHKGCCEYTTHFRGQAGHGSMPDNGVNAVEYAVRYVSRLLELAEALKSRVPSDSRFDPPWTTINTGGLRGGISHNVIPQTASVDWEFRPVQDSDFTFVKSEIEAYANTVLLPAMRAVNPNASITTETIAEVVGLEPATENEARDIVAELTKSNGADVVPFGTEAGIFASLGMSAVICGPGSIEQAHKADEYLGTDQLSACLTMLDGLGNKLQTVAPKH